MNAKAVSCELCCGRGRVHLRPERSRYGWWLRTYMHTFNSERAMSRWAFRLWWLRVAGRKCSWCGGSGTMYVMTMETPMVMHCPERRVQGVVHVGGAA